MSKHEKSIKRLMEIIRRSQARYMRRSKSSPSGYRDIRIEALIRRAKRNQKRTRELRRSRTR